MSPKGACCTAFRGEPYTGLSCRLPQLTAAIELVSEISRQLNDRKNEAVAEITSTFEELERVLHQRKAALVTDLENICSTKQKVRYPFTHALGSCGR